MCYSERHGKVYCANMEADTLTVIDAAGDSVLKQLAIGDRPYALLYDPAYDKVYCANWSSNDVAVLDAATDVVIGTLPVMNAPCALARNPLQGRVYVANNTASSISVLADSGGAVEETPNVSVRTSNPATIIRGVLFLPEARGERREARVELLDVSGRRVLVLKLRRRMT